jgi:hypothetical protein
MRRSLFPLYWSILFLTGQALMFVGGFWFMEIQEPILLDTLTFDQPLKEGYSTNATIIQISSDYGLRFDEPDQYVMTPLFNTRQSLSIVFTWLAFSMVEFDVTSTTVLEIHSASITVLIPGTDLHIDAPLKVDLDVQGNNAIEIHFVSPWFVEGSKIIPTVYRMEIYDGQVR